MPNESNRGDKVAVLIAREIAVLIQQDLRDPRLGLITISDVKVSRDLSFADVYFTVLPLEKSEEAEQVLGGAAGFLRKELSRKISLRITPKLRFHYDETIDRGARLSQAIDKAMASDVRNECSG
ncbi:MAG TPA: 30S ribosome-binding factor RbfA [Gammaproteobacteria bacterium]|nr:30S ribosome-binding factor RbfA [Gammaproteobacteria bacterium]